MVIILRFEFYFSVTSSIFLAFFGTFCFLDHSTSLVVFLRTATQREQVKLFQLLFDALKNSTRSTEAQRRNVKSPPFCIS